MIDFQEMKELKKEKDRLARSIFLRYIDKHPESSKSTYYPVYFSTELNISDTYLYLKKLFKLGLVKENDNKLELTQKGRDAIVKEYIDFFDNSTPHVKFEEYVKTKKLLKEDASFESIMINILSYKLKFHNDSLTAAQTADLILDLALLYERTGENRKAMSHYIKSLCLDVIGWENVLAHPKKIKKQVLQIRPEVMRGIERLAVSYEPNDITSFYREHNIDESVFSRNDMLDLVEDIRNKKFEYFKWRDNLKNK